MRTQRSSRGIAIITAMLITALVGSVAAGLAWNNALDVRRTMSLLFHEQGTQVAMGAETWIANILRDDSIESDTDHLGELWASELPGLPVDNDSVQGAVTGKVEDLQGRFNVNNLVDGNGKIDPEYVDQFRRLLRALDLDERFAGIAADWIDADQNASIPDGAEDPIYTGLFPPYRAPNQPIVNVTELAALENMDKASFDRLLPHITALPVRTPINVNTATAAVLMSISDNIDAAEAESLIKERAEAPFEEVQTRFTPFFVVPSQQGANPQGPAPEDMLTTDTQYFQLKAVVQIDTVRVTYFSVLHRVPQGGGVTTLFRSIGAL